MKSSGNLANTGQMGMFSKSVYSIDVNIQRGWTGSQVY